MALKFGFKKPRKFPEYGCFAQTSSGSFPDHAHDCTEFIPEIPEWSQIEPGKSEKFAYPSRKRRR
jgi:hypothetical protein